MTPLWLLLTGPWLLLSGSGLLLSGSGLLLTGSGLLLAALGLLLAALWLLLTALLVAAALSVRERGKEHYNQGNSDQPVHTHIPLVTLQGYPRLPLIVPERCGAKRPLLPFAASPVTVAMSEGMHLSTTFSTYAEGRTRTCTGIAPQGILSPLRLPISPPRLSRT